MLGAAPGEARLTIAKTGPPLGERGARAGRGGSRARSNPAARIVAVYAILSMVWIFFSDQLLAMVVRDSAAFARGATVKGFAFVVTTSVLLWFFIRRDTEELSRSEERYRTLAEAAHDVIFIIGRDYRIEYTNSYAVRLFGAQREDLAGKELAPLFPPEIAQRMIANLRHVFETGTPLRVEGRVVFPGCVNWQETWLAPVRNDRGEVEAVLGIGRDITERKGMEFALRESEARYRTLAEAAQDSIYIVERDFHLSYINGAGASLLNATPEKVIGMSLEEIFTPEVAEHARSNFSHVFETGEPMYSEVEVGLPSGAIWQGNAIVPLRNDLGEIVGVLGIGRDITERMQADQLKSDFISMVSHELRTPLSSIIGYAAMLAKLHEADDEAIFAKVVDKIQERGHHMARLVDELLESSRIQSGDFQLRVSSVDLAEVARQCIDAVFVPEGPPVDLNVMEDMPAVVCDRARMGDAVSNLLANAVKFSPSGGRVEVSVAADGDTARISVCDHGIGIQQSEMPRIFDRFTQADMSSTRSFGGFGMGLFIAKMIVEAHGGTIEATSVPGEGSTFTVELPVAGPAGRGPTHGRAAQDT